MVNREAYITTMVDHMYDVVDEYFDLVDDILTDPSVPERADKALALNEGIKELRKQIELLQLLRYRMSMENGGTNENSG